MHGPGYKFARHHARTAQMHSNFALGTTVKDTGTAWACRDKRKFCLFAMASPGAQVLQNMSAWLLSWTCLRVYSY